MDSLTITSQEENEVISPYKKTVLGDVFQKQSKNYDISNIQLDSLSRQDQIKILQNIDQVQHSDLLQFSYKVLQKTPWSRKKFDCYILKQTFSNIEFFSNLALDQGQDALFNCFQSMQLETFQEKQFVFNQGEVGRKFYIILKGQVSVLCKISKVKETQQQQQQSFDQKQDNNAINQSKFQQTYRSKTQKRPRKVKYHPLWPGVPEDRVKEINLMKQGQFFGQLALINDQPRQASVVCLEECHFAVLNKSDYKQIVSKAQEKKMKQYLDFLSSIPCFKGLSRRGLNMLIFSFQFRNLSFREYVYRQGENDGDNIYIIKEGQFKLIKNLQLKKDIIEGDYTYQDLTKKCLPCTKQAQRSAEIAVLGPGEIFGDYESLKKIKRVVTAICVSDTSEILQISIEELQKKVQILNEEDVFSNIKLQGAYKSKWHNKFLNIQKNISDSFKNLLAYMEMSNDKFSASAHHRNSNTPAPRTTANSPNKIISRDNSLKSHNQQQQNQQLPQSFNKIYDYKNQQKKKVMFLDNNNNNLFLTQDEVQTYRQQDKNYNKDDNIQNLSYSVPLNKIKLDQSQNNSLSPKQSQNNNFQNQQKINIKTSNNYFIQTPENKVQKPFFDQVINKPQTANQFKKNNQSMSLTNSFDIKNNKLNLIKNNHNIKEEIMDSENKLKLQKVLADQNKYLHQNQKDNSTSPKNKQLSSEKSQRNSKKKINAGVKQQAIIRNFKQIDEEFIRELDPKNTKFLEIKQNLLDKMMNNTYQQQNNQDQQIQNTNQDSYIQDLSEYNGKYGLNILDYLQQDIIQKNKEKLINQQKQINLYNIFGQTQPIDRIMTERINKRRLSTGYSVHINPKAFLNFVNIA